MDADLLRTCEMFINNRKLLADNFKWEGSEMHLIGSAVLTAHGVTPEPVRLKEMEKMIRSRAGILSPLRGYLKIIMICNMYMEDDPAEYYDNVERAFKMCRFTRRIRDERFYLAAMAMANTIQDKEELLELADRSNEIYSIIKSSGSMFDDGREFMTAAVLASAGVTDPEAFAAEAEKCSELLENSFGRTEYTEALSYILTLDKAEPEFKCARVREIYKMLDMDGIRYGKGVDLPVLGSVAMLDMTNADTVAALSEADAFLRSNPGFGRYGCGNDKRHMYSALMVLSAYASVLQAEPMAEAAVLERALQSQLAAMAAGTMMITSSVFENLTSNVYL